jgi:hypothetical protein
MDSSSGFYSYLMLLVKVRAVGFNGRWTAKQEIRSALPTTSEVNCRVQKLSSLWSVNKQVKVPSKLRRNVNSFLLIPVQHAHSQATVGKAISGPLQKWEQLKSESFYLPNIPISLFINIIYTLYK